MDSAILTQKRAIAAAQRSLNEAMNQEDISFKAILGAKLELKEFKNGLVELEALKEELF